MSQDRKILKLQIVLKSGYVVTTYTYADAYGVTFSPTTGQCSHYHLDIPMGKPTTRIACDQIAAIIEQPATVDRDGELF